MAPKQWLIVGASRGIGKEFVDQILARGDEVIATVRKDPASFWPDRKECRVLTCDVAVEESITRFVDELAETSNLEIDYVVVNAGILQYPNRATEMSFDKFSAHMVTNAIGPIICAQKLLKAGFPIKAITFISSDSGSAQAFRAMEDGFAAYAASKAALNQALRHMAAELERKGRKTTILALHPGEVKTDMANIEVDWVVEGQMEPAESVESCIKVIESKSVEDTGTFWTWDNQPYPW